MPLEAFTTHLCFGMFILNSKGIKCLVVFAPYRLRMTYAKVYHQNKGISTRSLLTWLMVYLLGIMNSEKKHNIQSIEASEANFASPEARPEGLGGEPDKDREIVATPEKEHLLETQYGDVIKTHAPVDSGKEGIIYRMETSEVPDEVKNVYAEAGHPLEADSALKVLKVYSSGKAKREYGFQLQAHSIVEEHLKRNPQDVGKYARVPNPIDYRKIHIDDQTREQIARAGGAITGQEVEVLLMDFIEGKDLATEFYLWILEHSPKDKDYVVQNTNIRDFHQLQQAVENILDFTKIKPSDKSEAEKIADQHRVNNLNAQKVYDFLRRTGYKLDSNVVTQITNTRKLLEDARLFHNDEHERNHMIGDDGQVYLIDYAKASSQPANDEAVINLEQKLRELTPEYREREVETLQRNALARIKLLSHTKPIVERYQTAMKLAQSKEGGLKDVVRHSSLTALTHEKQLDEFTGLLVKLVDDGNMSGMEAGAILAGMKEHLVVKKRVGRQTVNSVINRPLYNKIENYRSLFS